MKNKKVRKKINLGKKHIMAKTLTCVCGCHGKQTPALAQGYVHSFV